MMFVPPIAESHALAIMLHVRVVGLVWILAVTCTPPAVAQANEYRRLTNDELKTLLAGSSIDQPDVLQSYARTREEFEPNGTYIRHTDNYEGRGKYTIRDNSVCVTDKVKGELCRHVLVDRAGEYWITKRNLRPGFIRISVSPIRN